jgi:transposase
VRKVWNQTLAWRHRRRRRHGEGLGTNVSEANAYLTAMKRLPEFAYLSEVSSVPLQQVLRIQQKASANFFAQRARYPRFKSRTGRRSAEYTRSGFRWREGRLHLAKQDTPLEIVWSWPDVDPAGLDPSTVTVSRAPDGRWYVSSKTCSACGHRLAELSLVTRAWTCPTCRTRHDRDENGAKNILAAGLAVAPRGDACGADVRRGGQPPRDRRGSRNSRP